MNSVRHDELIDSLAELRQALPSVRLGQLIANMATVARGAVAGAVWEMTDDELLGAIRWQLEQLAARPAGDGAEPGAAPACGGITSSHASAPPQPPRQVS